MFYSERMNLAEEKNNVVFNVHRNKSNPPNSKCFFFSSQELYWFLYLMMYQLHHSKFRTYKSKDANPWRADIWRLSFAVSLPISETKDPHNQKSTQSPILNMGTA